MRPFFTGDSEPRASGVFREGSLRGLFLRVGFTLAVMGLSLWPTFNLPASRTPISYSFFICAIAMTAYFAGWEMGLLSTAMAGLIGAWVLPPVRSLAIEDRGDAFRLASFLLSALLVCFIIASLHRSRQALRVTRDALRLSKRRIEYVERHAKVWTWEYDLRSNRVSWSNLYGNTISRREQALSDWLQMIHEEDRERVADAIRTAISRGEFEARFRIMLGDSQPRWLLGRAQLVLMDGQPAALVGINMDASFHGDFVPVAAEATAQRPA